MLWLNFIEQVSTIYPVFAVHTLHGATFVVGIVFEKKNLLFFSGFAQHPFFFLHRCDGECIVCRYPGDGQCRLKWDYIARENHSFSSKMDVRHQLTRGMSVEKPYLHLRSNVHILLNEFQPAGFFYRNHVFGEVGVAFTHVGIQKIFPLRFSHPVSGVREGGDYL